MSSPVPCLFPVYLVQGLRFSGLADCPFVIVLTSLQLIIVLFRPPRISLSIDGGQVYLLSALSRGELFLAT